MSDTVKGALIIGICLMLGLWGAGWLNRIPEEITINGIPEEITINDLGNIKIQLRGQAGIGAPSLGAPMRIELTD